MATPAIPAGSRPVVRVAPASGPPRISPAKVGALGTAPGVGLVQTGSSVAPPKPPPAPTATPAATTPAVTPPDLSGDKYQAYLTPDQLATLQTAGINASSGVTAQTQSETDAQGNYATTMADAQYAHDVGTQQANDAAAGRGMFLSSVRQNDLTDINRTLLEKQTAASTNLSSLIASATNAISALNANYGVATLDAQGDAAAQVPSPVLPPVAPAAPAAQAPPVPTGPPLQQPRSIIPAPARPGAKTPRSAVFTMTGSS